jgi:phosphonate transport system substrate-binding protein
MLVLLALLAAADRPLVITAVPFDNPEEQRAVFGLLSQHLARRLDREVRFESSSSYDDVIDSLAKGKADVAFLGAAAYLQARRTGQARAILKTVRHKKTEYFGVFVVKRGSPLKTLEQLKGKKVAFVDPNSTGGFHFPRQLLRARGMDPDKDVVPVFAGGHHKVVKMVAAGEVEAGACFEGAEAVLPDPDSVVAIARTEPVPNDPVVVRPGLGPDVIKRLRSALMELTTLPEARNFFTFSEIDGFVPAVDGDYDAVAQQIQKGG